MIELVNIDPILFSSRFYFLGGEYLVATYVFMRHLDSYCVRVGSLNVRTVTGRGRALADMMERLEWCLCRRLEGRGTK